MSATPAPAYTSGASSDPAPTVTHAVVSRRGFLARVAAGVGAAATSRWALAGGGVVGLSSLSGATAAGPFTEPLRIPAVLTDPAITLVAAEADVQVLPGAPTRMWTFNGTFPGPTIRRPAGERTTLTVLNRLPADAGTLSVHHHGAHADPDNDGHPLSPVVPVAGQRDYVYDLVEDGEAERAATQWYHDHTHFLTSRNTWKGLVGLFIVDDAVDAALPLPEGQYDVPLVVTDRTFDAQNQLTAPYKIYGEEFSPGVGGGHAPDDDVIGRQVLVNGVIQPYFEVAPRKYRFRVLNAAHFRPYNLQLSDGSPLVQIGTESGLLPAPVERPAILLGPAERAEFVIDFAEMLEPTVRLVSRAQGGVGATAAAAEALVEFRITGSAVDDSAVPAALRPLPGWAASAPTTPSRVWAFGVGVDPQGRPAWTVNGQAFDHERVDARPVLGTVETWAFVNTTPNKSHYIHIHDVDWLLVSRNGARPTPAGGEAGLKETFRLDPGEVIYVAAKFSDHLGKYMIHCHMLEHEDHGMMTTWEVVKPGAGDAVRTFDAALERDVPEPAVRAHVTAVMKGACDGRTLDRSTLSRLELEAIAMCREQSGHTVTPSAAHAVPRH